MSSILGIATLMGVGYFFFTFLVSMFMAETDRSVGLQADTNGRIFVECFFSAVAFSAIIWGMLEWWAQP